MKIKKNHFSEHSLKLLIRIAFFIIFMLINWFVHKDRELSPALPDETQSTQTHHMKHKKKASKSSSAEPTRKKRNKNNRNKKRPVSASRRKKAEVETAERKAALECLLYEDSLN
jgi:hypothetical protein